jgi:hypothetical protein
MKSFCYERSFDNRWCPTFYAGPPLARPPETRNDRSTVWQVNEHLTLSQAADRYPQPKEPVVEVEKFSIWYREDAELLVGDELVGT